MMQEITATRRVFPNHLRNGVSEKSLRADGCDALVGREYHVPAEAVVLLQDTVLDDIWKQGDDHDVHARGVSLQNPLMRIASVGAVNVREAAGEGRSRNEADAGLQRDAGQSGAGAEGAHLNALNIVRQLDVGQRRAAEKAAEGDVTDIVL